MEPRSSGKDVAGEIEYGHLSCGVVGQDVSRGRECICVYNFDRFGDMLWIGAQFLIERGELVSNKGRID